MTSGGISQSHFLLVLHVQARNLMARLEALIQTRLEAKLAVLPPPVSVGVPLEGEAGTRLQAAHALATNIHSSRSQVSFILCAARIH